MIIVNAMLTRNHQILLHMHATAHAYQLLHIIIRTVVIYSIDISNVIMDQYYENSHYNYYATVASVEGSDDLLSALY